jgi:hypothetical protein
VGIELKGLSLNSNVSSVKQVSNQYLLALYIVAPACVFIVLLDWLFFDGYMQYYYLPVKPSEWAFWAVFFNFPHIVASFITLADRDYLTFYKKPILRSIITITLLVGSYLLGLNLLSQPHGLWLNGLFFIFFATYTMYHVLAQQFGLSLMMLRQPSDAYFRSWLVLSTFSTVLMYGMIFTKSYLLSANIYVYTFYEIFAVITTTTLFLGSLFGLKLALSARCKQGRHYVYANVAMSWCAYFCLMMGYSVFVILIPRVIHDVTAFMIYSTHDHNRNLPANKNLIYSVLKIIPLSPLWLNPMLAIAIAASINYFSSVETMQVVLIVCGLFHYYMEGIIWKREGIHRKSVSFN